MSNPMAFLQGFKNPQTFLQQMMNNSQLMQNPIARNTMEMMKKNDAKGLEQLARNLYQEKGMNVDDKMSELKKMFGM